jgi:hypothetical protein
LLNSDRLLVIGSAELELLVFELAWLDGSTDVSGAASDYLTAEKDSEDNTCAKKTRKANESLVGADFLQEEGSQSNVYFRCMSKPILFNFFRRFCDAKNVAR